MNKTSVWKTIVCMVLITLVAACTPTAEITEEAAQVAVEPTTVGEEAPPAVEETEAVEEEQPVAEEQEPTEEGPKYGGTLVVGSESDLITFDPIKSLHGGDEKITYLTYESIVAPNLKGEFVGVLAESFEKSDDGKEYTFHIRKGVKFHNGEELTADDVKWMYDHAIDEAMGGQTGSVYRGMGLKVDVVDEYTVKMTIESGLGPFLSYISLLNRTAIIHRDSYDADWNIVKPIGTGPFMVDSYKPGDSYTLVKNPDYWMEGLPYLDKIIIKIITDPNARLNALRTGEIGFTHSLPISEVKNLLEEPDPNFSVEVYYINSGQRVNFNHTRPPFNDKNARQAVQYAFDREAYNEAVYFGLGQVHNQPVVPDDAWHFDVPMIDPDLEKAKEYFKASGLPEGTKFTLMLTPDQKDAGEMIQAMLGQVGFDVELDIVEAAMWTTKGKELDYDMMIGTMAGIFDPDRIYSYLHSTSGSSWLVGGYNNPDMDRLIDAGKSEADYDKRVAIYTEMLNLIQDEAATMYVVGIPWNQAWSNSLKGYSVSNLTAFNAADGSVGLSHVWLDQ